MEDYKALQAVIRKSDEFDTAISLIRRLHADLHAGSVHGKEPNAIDLLYTKTKPEWFNDVHNTKGESIAWSLWHIARIEDLTMNILVDGGQQVFNAEWQERIGVNISDTGNAMSTEDIITFGQTLRPDELINYRNAVGRRSIEIIDKLTAKDMKRKFPKEAVQRIIDEGGLTQDGASIWLADFWGRKDVAGIMLMPLTRHQPMHLNSCMIWTERLSKKKC